MPRQKIIDEFTPTAKVGDNKYRLPDGRVVSRQRIEQLRHPDRNRARARKRYAAGPGKTYAQDYYERNKDRFRAWSRARYARAKAERNQA